MSKTLVSAFVAGFVTVTSTAVLFAHPDDPKLRDRVPPYHGNAYRRGGPPGVQALLPPFPANGIELLSWLPLNLFGAQMTSANSCFGYVSPSGREYAIIGLSHGTGFVEVTDPENAQIVGFITGPTSLWRDVRTYSHYCYAVSEGGSGIQVMDLAQIDSGAVTLVNTVTTGGTMATHTLMINTASGFLYRAGGSSNGLRIYSLANPVSPALVATWSDKYTHEVTVVTYTSGPYAGREIAFCCGGFNGGTLNTGLDILDVTNKAAITVLGHHEYTGAEFCHQGWLDASSQYFYIDDELDEENLGIPTTTIIISVSNLSDPHEVGRFTNNNPSIGHNLYVKGNLIFEASYRAGLRVYDATNPLAPVEVAYFDTWPEDDNPNFNGLWNNYPYLPSGTIIGSDIEKGLFVWRLGNEPLAFAYPNGQPQMIAPSGGSFVVHISEQSGGQLAAGTAVLHYDAGAGVVDTPLVARGGGDFDATFPSLPCGATVRYWFTAQSTSGSTVTDPPGAPAAGTFTVVIGLGRFVSFSDDMEADRGWVVGAPDDDATTGVWTRVDPIGTNAQPENDHTVGAATRAWVTGQGGAGGGVGDADVDGGKTTLRTPQLNLTGLHDPVIGYWRWYSNTEGGAPNADVFTVDVSADDGASWVSVETVGPGGPDTSGGWIYHEFRVAALVTPTSRVRVRFVASDNGAGSVIEAAVDDFQVADVVCVDCNGNGIDDATDIARGTSLDGNGDSVPDECQDLVLAGPLPGQAGVVNTVTVSGATPGAGVRFFTGGSAGSTAAPGCPSSLLGIASPRARRTINANSSGQVTVSTFVRSSLRGRTILVQALDVTDCRLSNLVTHTFQ